MANKLNQWQTHFCNTYYEGKLPRTKDGKYKLDLLGQVKSKVKVIFADGEEKIFTVTLDENNIPQGLISVSSLASNLVLWMSRGHKISTF